jgi:hypothetical protein
MTHIKQGIEDKYGITHTPSPATLQKQQDKATATHNTRAEIDKQVRLKFPDLDKAYDILYAHEEYRHYKAPKYGYQSWVKPEEIAKRRELKNKAKAKALKSLEGSQFGSAAQAANYRALANKLKGQLLVRAHLR